MSINESGWEMLEGTLNNGGEMGLKGGRIRGENIICGNLIISNFVNNSI